MHSWESHVDFCLNMYNLTNLSNVLWLPKFSLINVHSYLWLKNMTWQLRICKTKFKWLIYESELS